jgi:hypothetical protein
MKINLTTGSKSSEEQQKIVYWLASEMVNEYKLVSSAVMYFVNEGNNDFCNWIKQTHNVNVSRFLFRDSIQTYGAGFDFEDSPELTRLLLKVPAGKLVLK